MNKTSLSNDRRKRRHSTSSNSELTTHWAGLYYPFIHFRNDAWLKFAALYWDKIARIVPDFYKPHDLETVRILAEELGIIENFAPTPESYDIEDVFLRFLERNAKRLRSRYAVKHAPTWDINPDRHSAAPENADPHLAYIFDEKLTPKLRDAFVETGLATTGGDDSRWVGMNKRLFSVYMALLAERIANRNHLHPLSSDPQSHVILDSWSPERLAQVLLDEKELAPKQPTQSEVWDLVATMTFQLVAPKDLNTIPVRAIVELRRHHRGELTALQSKLAVLSSELASVYADAGSQGLKLHVETEVNKTLANDLEALEKRFQALGVDTVRRFCNLRAAAPPLVAAALPSIGIGEHQPLYIGAGLMFGMATVIFEARKEAHEAVTSSPAAYLLHAKEALGPQPVYARVQRNIRRLVYAV